MLTFDQALDDSRHLNTTLDDGDLCDEKRRDESVDTFSSIPGLMDQNVKYFEIVGN